jgi:hypothetical protein
VHPPETRRLVLDLVAEGHNDCEIARRTGVARRTVSAMRRADPPNVCLGCWARSKPMLFTPEEYAELLGLYLGDGHVARLGRTFSLRISLDRAHPGIVDDTEALLGRCLPHNRVQRVRVPGSGVVVVQTYHSHLPCVLPQHGAGRKHERPIVLERWQRAIVDRAPWAFLRGCIRSDGCAFVNRTGRYEYLSYDFANRSSDILDLFGAVCHAVGVEHRRYERHIRVYRRASVALLLEHVGRKS